MDVIVNREEADPTRPSPPQDLPTEADAAALEELGVIGLVPKPKAPDHEYRHAEPLRPHDDPDHGPGRNRLA